MINIEETAHKGMLRAKGNTAILKKNSGMHFLRVTNRTYKETYIDSVKKAKPYIGSFGTIKWI